MSNEAQLGSIANPLPIDCIGFSHSICVRLLFIVLAEAVTRSNSKPLMLDGDGTQIGSCAEVQSR